MYKCVASALSFQDCQSQRQKFATRGTQTETENGQINAESHGDTFKKIEKYPMRIPIKYKQKKHRYKNIQRFKGIGFGIAVSIGLTFLFALVVMLGQVRDSVEAIQTGIFNTLNLFYKERL